MITVPGSADDPYSCIKGIPTKPRIAGLPAFLLHIAYVDRAPLELQHPPKQENNAEVSGIGQRIMRWIIMVVLDSGFVTQRFQS